MFLREDCKASLALSQHSRIPRIYCSSVLGLVNILPASVFAGMFAEKEMEGASTYKVGSRAALENGYFSFKVSGHWFRHFMLLPGAP